MEKIYVFPALKSDFCLQEKFYTLVQEDLLSDFTLISVNNSEFQAGKL